MSGPSHHQVNSSNIFLICEHNSFAVGQEGVGRFMLQVEGDGLVDMRCSHLDKHLLVHPHMEDSRSGDEESAHQEWKVEGLMTLLLHWDHHLTHFQQCWCKISCPVNRWRCFYSYLAFTAFCDFMIPMRSSTGIAWNFMLQLRAPLRPTDWLKSAYPPLCYSIAGALCPPSAFSSALTRDFFLPRGNVKRNRTFSAVLCKSRCFRSWT